MAHENQENQEEPMNTQESAPQENLQDGAAQTPEDEMLEDYQPLADDTDIDTAKLSQQASPHDAEMNALKEQLAKTKDQMIRALAEAENTRRRAIKEREDASKFAVSKFSKDLIGVADNLRRALDAFPAEEAEQNPTIKNLIDGIEATERVLLTSFAQNGIEKVEPLDQPFNPDFHEVMFEAPIPGKAAGTVIQVIEAGYTLNGRILRPARVGIAKDDGKEPGKTLDTEA